MFYKMKNSTCRNKRNQEKNTIEESLLNSDALTGDVASEIKGTHLGLLSKQGSKVISSVQTIQN